MSAPATTPRMTLLAHRGASHAAPENTLAAFARALDVEGADGLELDVRLSRDLVPVIFPRRAHRANCAPRSSSHAPASPRRRSRATRSIAPAPCCAAPT